MDISKKRILYEQNADKPIPPASLTKVLTMFVVLDRVKERKLAIDSMVQISPRAAATRGSSMGLDAGEKISIDSLLRGMAVASGNDAAVAVAQHVAGSEAAFVRMMNQKARQLGMNSSIFKNVHGLPAKGQQTTARDMLTLTSRYLLAHPEALTLYHSQRYLAHKGYTPNTNPLLGTIEGVDGLKTGYVDASGFNLITTARRGNTRLVNVLLGAPNKSIRLHEATRLMETGFQLASAEPSPPQDSAKKNTDKTSAKPEKQAKQPLKTKSSVAPGSPKKKNTPPPPSRRSAPGQTTAQTKAKTTAPTTAGHISLNTRQAGVSLP